jgi:DNA-directed RNA polymerase subunit RPC12/RpoP
MAKMRDYCCMACGTDYEFLHHPAEEMAICPNCGSDKAESRASCGKLLTVIIPVYPGCKRVKAGFVHSHGDRPAEKGSVSVPRTSFKGDHS